MPRLLYVVNDPGFFLSHRLPLAEHGVRMGYDVHVATGPGDGSAQARRAGEAIAARFSYHPLRLSRASRAPAGEAESVHELWKLYRRLRPDLVHHVTIKPILYGGVAAQLAGVPHVVHAVSGLGYVFLRPGRGPALLRRGVLQAFALAMRGSRVIFQNDDDRRLFERAGAVRAEQCWMVRGSGVDLARHPLRPLPEGRPLVVLPARLLWDKGVGELVTAARRLRHRHDARFALVGAPDPNPAAVDTDTLEAWRREGAVELWGHRDDMPAVLAQARIVCLPSYREGMPKALLEAAASGRPIVTTDVPGCRDVVRHGEHGLLVPARDPGALTAALATLLEAPALCKKMGEAARRRAEAEFSVQRVVEQTFALYDAMQSRRP